MRSTNAFLLFIPLLLFSCQTDKTSGDQKQVQAEPKAPEQVFQNKAHELVYKMTQKVGDYEQLRAMKDVSYTYTYTTPDQQVDQSTEKYIFDGELSYGIYERHERTLPELKGPIEQGYDGHNFWLKHDGKYIDDEQSMKRVTFNRKTNFYWFTMMQKLMDPGLVYEYVKKDQEDGKVYDVVKVTFGTDQVKPTDIYVLWINRESSLVDKFLFTVADFGKVEVPFLMKLKYEQVDGFQIPSKRLYTQANWEGQNINEDWIKVTWTDISFNNDLSTTIFEKQ